MKGEYEMEIMPPAIRRVPPIEDDDGRSVCSFLLPDASGIVRFTVHAPSLSATATLAEAEEAARDALRKQLRAILAALG